MKVFLQDTIIKKFETYSAKIDRQPAATPDNGAEVQDVIVGEDGAGYESY